MTTTQTQASWYNNVSKIAFISMRRCSVLYVLGKEGKSLISLSPSFPSSSPGRQPLAKGTYTLNNATFLLQKEGSLEVALTHTSEKRNILTARCKGSSPASLASADRWEKQRPGTTEALKKLRAATLCYSTA